LVRGEGELLEFSFRRRFCGGVEGLMNLEWEGWDGVEMFLEIMIECVFG